MICSRCHGTLRSCPSWQALLRLGSSLHAWHAVSLRPERSGGFLWRWDHRLQRPSIRAGSHARHPILYASVDESWKSCRRLPHLNDGLLCRPGIFAGRLHHPPDLGACPRKKSLKNNALELRGGDLKISHFPETRVLTGDQNFLIFSKNT